jgi:hypothetical protein
MELMMSKGLTQIGTSKNKDLSEDFVRVGGENQIKVKGNLSTTGQLIY